MRDLGRFLPLRSQFLLWGNTRDRFAAVEKGSLRPLPLPDYLAAHLGALGVPHFLAYTPTDGLRIVGRPGIDLEQERAFFRERFQISWVDGSDVVAMSSEAFFQLLPRLVANATEPIGVAVEMASRLMIRPDALSDSEHALFTRALLLSQRASPIPSASTPPVPRFNPIFWLADREGDLPDWLILENPRLRSIPIPEPDGGQRREFVKALCRGSEEVTDEILEAVVNQTDGMRLNDLLGIVQLGRVEGLSMVEVPEAARRYRLGVTEDPWRKIDRAKIAQAEEFVGRRVKGQSTAVTAMLDIVKRAVMGISGTGKRSNRPRGVAFLAGPTGTGKTELAKTITELLFGDEQAYIRFDMSEFSAEHSDQRLIGAPPGYLGYDSGGELTNAIRERPFSLVLFDEIEKAHPRILDKFLQILDDGVLTSGRGERVYFSEAVIVFTSNLGISQSLPDGTRITMVSASDPYEKVASQIRAGIEAFFKLEIGRPEILNRLGENIMIFDFIRPEIAREIFETLTRRIFHDLHQETGLHFSLTTEAAQALASACLGDLSNGGRGIRNELESHLVNPLARALFCGGFEAGDRVMITEVRTKEGLHEVILQQGNSRSLT